MTKRQAALEAMVTRIKAANGAGSYVYNLSLYDRVSLAIETVDARFRKNAFTVRVQDGQETRNDGDLNSYMYSSDLDMRLSCLVVDNSAETIVRQLNDLLGDVTRAIAADETLQGTVTRARVERIDQPLYNADEQRYGHAVVHVAVHYDYDASSEA